MQPDDLTRVRHMFEAAENALRFISGKNRADLDTDVMLLFALVRAIEIIGEAASKLSAEQRAASPTVPWSAIVAMRNRLIHAYFDIDKGYRMEDSNGGDSVASVPATATAAERLHHMKLGCAARCAREAPEFLRWRALTIAFPTLTPKRPISHERITR